MIGSMVGRDGIGTTSADIASARIALLGTALLGTALLGTALLGCSAPPYPLPDRGAVEVRAEERRLAALLPGALLWGPGTCEARLLGRAGRSSFAWADCRTTPTADLPAGGVSMPVRVTGEQVDKPADGGDYAGSVRKLFPPQLADLALRDPDRLRP